MKIIIKPFMSIKKAMGDKPEIEIEMKKGSIKNLIEELSGKYGKKLSVLIFGSNTNEIKPYCHILVNGRNYLDLPERIKAQLKTGDVVAFFPPVGGG